MSSLFNLEESLKKSIEENKITKTYQQYLDIYSKEVVCLRDDKGIFISEDGETLEDQNRYSVMIEMCALEEGKLLSETSDTNLKLFLDSKEL